MKRTRVKSGDRIQLGQHYALTVRGITATRVDVAIESPEHVRVIAGGGRSDADGTMIQRPAVAEAACDEASGDDRGEGRFSEP